jgi:hypothetical protein
MTYSILWGGSRGWNNEKESNLQRDGRKVLWAESSVNAKAVRWEPLHLS